MIEKQHSGMTLVDNYWIPDEEVEAYMAERDMYRSRIMELATAYFPEVTTAFAGSEDGEAVVAYRADGSFRFLIHLDPMRIREMKEADAKGELEAYFIEVCEISEEKRR